jgi:hypothetical protein
LRAGKQLHQGFVQAGKLAESALRRARCLCDDAPRGLPRLSIFPVPLFVTLISASRRLRVVASLLALALAALPCLARAQGSNVPELAYPHHKCVRPAKPQRPFNPNEARSVDAYNAQVEAYNKQVDVYVACIRAYVDNANADIEKIQAKKRAAIEHTQ